MTSNDKIKQEIVTYISNKLSILNKYGFSNPVITKDSWSTTLDWLLNDIALEIELDWREFDIYVFVVRLEKGKLPKGYYVSEGKPCRIYLQQVIKDQKWKVNQDSLKAISPNKSKSQKIKRFSTELLKEHFLEYKIVLESCIDNLIADHRLIFSEKSMAD